MTVTPVRHRRQPDRGAEQLPPRLDMGCDVEVVPAGEPGQVGVQDARISSCAAAPSSAIPPKFSVATRVTVPEAAW